MLHGQTEQKRIGGPDTSEKGKMTIDLLKCDKKKGWNLLTYKTEIRPKINKKKTSNHVHLREKDKTQTTKKLTNPLTVREKGGTT